MRVSTLIYSLVLFVVVVALAAYAVIATRRARRAQLERSQERATAMLMALHQEAARNTAPADARQSAAAKPAPAPPPSTGPILPAEVARRPRLLSDPQRLLYLVLRVGMPDHVVMANVRLIDLVDCGTDAAAVQADARLRVLASQRVDFLVCNRALEPIAALTLAAADASPAGDERAKIDTLRAWGVKFLRFRIGALPRPKEIRSLILG